MSTNVRRLIKLQCIFPTDLYHFQTMLAMSADISSIRLAIMFSEGGTLSTALTVPRSNISFTMALQTGSINATVCGFFDLGFQLLGSKV